jgi:hypothetical protein
MNEEQEDTSADFKDGVEWGRSQLAQRILNYELDFLSDISRLVAFLKREALRSRVPKNSSGAITAPQNTPGKKDKWLHSRVLACLARGNFAHTGDECYCQCHAVSEAKPYLPQ